MKDEDIIYSLAIEDIQNVAKESLGRNLSEDEVKTVVQVVENRIPWYEIIDDAITESIRS
ncbi:MAG TPA: hypothetical protein VNG71_01750 [Pyrinomonadaceae bacterium]|nr:hypothetical protein [Pyrinomonadaceae bacterium]